MKIEEVNDIRSEKLKIFSSLTEAQLRMASEDGAGLFIAESPKVIRVALERGYEPVALLCERKHIFGDAEDIVRMCEGITVYTGNRETLWNLTGYKLTRGVLCAMKRKPKLTVSQVAKEAKLICVIQGICDTTNIGSIFRSAAALGVDGIILSEDSCDPLNRRSIRVSMGTVFVIPWAVSERPLQELSTLNFKTVALALRDDSISLQELKAMNEQRLAVIFGTEGDGLPQKIISDADYVVKIPMYNNVDSLNVGSAAAITFWALK